MEKHKCYTFKEMIDSVFNSMERSGKGEYERLLYPDNEDNDEFIFWFDLYI